MPVIDTTDGWSVAYYDANGVGSLGAMDFGRAPIAQTQLSAIQEIAVGAGFADAVLASAPDDAYAARYQGAFTLDAEETIAFRMRSSGTAELWIDGVRVATAQGAETAVAVGPCPVTGNAVCSCDGGVATVAQTVVADLVLKPGPHTVELRFLDAAGADVDKLALDWRLGDAPTFSAMRFGEAPARALDLEGDGAWQGLIDWPIIPIHAMVLPDGKVLSFGTDERGVQGGQFSYALYDPATGEHQLLPNSVGTDIFCSNVAMDPYLDLTLMTGGDNRTAGEPNGSIADVTAFDYATQTIAASPTGDLNSARWYPGLLTLGDGRLMTIGGREAKDGNVGNDTIEVYSSGLGWRTLEGADATEIGAGKWWFPHAWQKADGDVLVIEPSSGQGGADVFLVDPNGAGRMEKIDTLPFLIGNKLPSMLYRTDKALMMAQDGGLWSVDFSGAEIAYTRVGDVGERRLDGNFSLLADGRVIVTGGTANDNQLNGQVRAAQIWDPETGVLETVESETLARLYHSTALLLPDGTVASMGGGAPGPLLNLNGEIFAPDYLFGPDGRPAERLEIAARDSSIQAGQAIVLDVDDAAAVARITAVKSGGVTHSRNADARFLELEFRAISATQIEVTTPENGNELTPGTWMLFALDAAGTPSVAEMIDVDPGRYLAEGVEGAYAFETSTYAVGPSGLTWTEANAWAQAQGGKLVEIDSAAENAFIAETFGGANPIWLGINDAAREGAWVGADGGAAAFTNWMPGEPNNYGAGQDYARIATASGQWDDGAAATQSFFDGRWRPSETLTVVEFESARKLVLQTGETSFVQTDRGAWIKVAFERPMDDPIVIVGPPTDNGPNPGVVRVRNVTETGFEMQMEEWEYLDGWHMRETYRWMAVERGVHVLTDGGIIEAGETLISRSRGSIELDGVYADAAPVVLGQIASENGAQTVTERIHSVSQTGFDVVFHEEEARRNGHEPESFHWVAFSAGNHTEFSAFADARAVDHRGVEIDLDRASAEDVFFAEMQSLYGGDTAGLRLSGLGDGFAEVFVEEERSRDREIGHVKEDLGWVVVDEFVYL